MKNVLFYYFPALPPLLLIHLEVAGIFRFLSLIFPYGINIIRERE
ncbi:Uncharacterized protein BM_BM17362 [Brugia malayi]|uniref:Uncharacterized protein n=1 Tax=Brugia malayi TaxID=6279 RepID=A0A4E9F470_BRUMA|nr:Uncharacterized protein BM_BM17362 [Brugia malayi]VIO90734.1 Uncharacterized protein BM_BM17362 [Brugia malayi]